MAFLRNRGWTAIDPERLPLAQQIQLFAGARAICGVHGAGLTNIVWCDRGCTIIELIADNYLNGCFESITSCLDVQHHYLIFSGDKEARIPCGLGPARASAAGVTRTRSSDLPERLTRRSLPCLVPRP